MLALTTCVFALVGPVANAKNKTRARPAPEIHCKTSKDCAANQLCVKSRDVGTCRPVNDEDTQHDDKPMQ